MNRDFFFDISLGKFTSDRERVSFVNKFGRNSAVGTTFTPVALGGVYQTPQPASATTLRVKAGNTNDTAAGTGARTVLIEGLNELGELTSEELVTAGTSASAASTNTYIRLFRTYVVSSGTYATSASPSHSADIVIENGAGGTTWATISSTDFARGQSEVGAYSVPLGKTAYVTSLIVSVDSTKAANLLFFQRQHILEASAPYESMRVVAELSSITGEESIDYKVPLGPFRELTDIGFMAKAAQAADVSVDFQIILVDDN